MPRKARVEFPGAVYHLLDRSDRQEAIFCDASSDPHTARGQLQSTSWSGGGSVSYTYLADGKVDHEEYANGVRSDFAYDGRGFVNLIRTYRQSSPQQTYSRREYWRDERDRITAWQKGIDDSANPMENGRGDRYEYDEEGQLWKASYQAEDPSGNAAHALRADLFYYDELGSRVDWNTVASRGAVHFSRRNNGLNQYSAWENGSPNHWGSGIYHDDNMPTPSPAPSPPWAWVAPGNGVTMQDGWITASFNALNQPVAMWSPAYPGGASPQFMWFGYDPLGRCVKRWIGPDIPGGPPPNSNPATYYYYDGWNLVQEGPSASAVDRTYVHGNRVDEIVASQVSGAWYYHHYDARGHCIMLTNANGGLQEQYDYDAFGYPHFYNAAGFKLVTQHTRFLFTGREWLGELRIYDFRNRQYQPELGRFLQPDPKQFAARDYNLYRYCHNDPVNKSDPTGLYWAFSDKKLEAEFNKARKAFNNNPTVKRIFDRVAADKLHRVMVNRSESFGRDRDQFKGTDQGNASFSWNPKAAVAFDGGKQSPATVLVHEAAHADRFLSNPKDSANAFRAGDGPMGHPGLFNNMEERRVILGPEASAAGSMPGEGARSSIESTYYKVDSVTDH